MYDCVIDNAFSNNVIIKTCVQCILNCMYISDNIVIIEIKFEQ